jgi:hypothetical protein
VIVADIMMHIMIDVDVRVVMADAEHTQEHLAGQQSAADESTDQVDRFHNATSGNDRTPISYSAARTQDWAIRIKGCF